MEHKYQNSTTNTNDITIEQDRLIGHTKAGHGMWFFQIFPKYQSLWFSTNPSTFIKWGKNVYYSFHTSQIDLSIFKPWKESKVKKRNLFFAKIKLKGIIIPLSLSFSVSWECSCFNIVLVLQACIFQRLKIFYYTIQTLPLIH